MIEVSHKNTHAGATTTAKDKLRQKTARKHTHTTHLRRGVLLEVGDVLPECVTQTTQLRGPFVRPARVMSAQNIPHQHQHQHQYLYQHDTTYKRATVPHGHVKMSDNRLHNDAQLASCRGDHGGEPPRVMSFHIPSRVQQAQKSKQAVEANTHTHNRTQNVMPLDATCPCLVFRGAVRAEVTVGFWFGTERQKLKALMQVGGMLGLGFYRKAFVWHRPAEVEGLDAGGVVHVFKLGVGPEYV